MPRTPLAKKPVKKTAKRVAKKPAVVAPTRSDARAASKQKQKELAKAADRFGGFRPAREVLRMVRAVPTWFAQFDHAGGVGGLPIERFMLLHGPSNHGKAQPIDERVLTPLGWREIGTLNVGDVVIGVNGKQTRVIGVFPQGVKQAYRVTFNDRTATECCDEHLWLTTTKQEHQRGRFARGPRPERRRIPTGVGGAGSVKTLAEIRESLNDEHAVPMVAPVRYVHETFVPDLHPYVMGLLLGDGSFKSSIYFHKPELDLRRKLAALLPGDDRLVEVDDVSVRIVGGATLRITRALGLAGKRSHERFVPRDYMHAEPEVRADLLRGLLDTDGHVTKEGSLVEYTTTSPQLAEDAAELARSLGAFVVVDPPRMTTYEYASETRLGRPSWRMRISFPNGECPVGSVKHLARWKPREKRRLKTIASIAPSREVECVCIAVDSPDRLYVTRDFIVTHNTIFALGLIGSFLARGHYAALVDAEFTTPLDWVAHLLGEHADSDRFYAMRPTSYESTVDSVRDFCKEIARLRADGKIAPDVSALIVVDSIRKLVPQNLMRKLAEGAEKHGVDGYGGRAAQIRAAMNAAWMDELVPLLAATQTAMLVIAREAEDPDADARAKQNGTAYKVGGGKSLYYESSQAIRVERAAWVYERKVEKGEDRLPAIGERHRVTIHKTKVAQKADRQQVAYFHTSNGVMFPEGFDRPRDLFELGIRLGVVEAAGSWFTVCGRRFQGELKAIKTLHEDPELLALLEREARAAFEKVPPIEHDDDGVCTPAKKGVDDDE